MNRKMNIGLALSQNFDKVTLDLLDENVEYNNEEEFEAEVNKRLFAIRQLIFKEFETIEEDRRTHGIQKKG